jgi:hypothetical protein
LVRARQARKISEEGAPEQFVGGCGKDGAWAASRDDQANATKIATTMRLITLGSYSGLIIA